MQLRNRHVWLIGASSGIGAALAPALARRGARLTISARNAAGLDAVAAGIDADVGVLPLDVTQPGAIVDAYAHVRSRGELDLLIYNAGAWQRTALVPFDIDAAETQIAVNYTGLVRSVAAVLPDMIQRGEGGIVGVSSLASYLAVPGAEVYGSSKAAASAFLQTLRLDCAPHGVEVVTVSPGFVDTPLTARNDFPMPFLMRPEAAADRIIRGLESGNAEIHFPRRLSWPLKLIRHLPQPLYERLGARLVRE